VKSFTHVSASQVSTFLSCERQWWWNKVFGLPTKQKPSAALGEAVHVSIETYLGGGDEGALHAVARPALSTLRRLRAVADLEVETRMQRPLRNGLTFVGRIDALSPSERLVVDHKTTSDLRWAKSEEDLQSDVQMLAYAYEVLARNPGEEVRVAHSVMQTRGLPLATYTEATISEARVRDGWARIEGVTDRMRATAQATSADQVPPDWSSCNKYGGCDFREQCAALKLAARSSPYDGVANVPSFSTPEVNMATKHSASLLRNMGLDDATIRAAILKGTCTDDVGLVSDAPKAAALAAGINPPEAPRPREQSAPPPAPAPVASKSSEQMLREQMQLLLANGWSQEEIDTLSDDAFQVAVEKNHKRGEVNLVMGTGLVQGNEYDDVVVRIEPVAAKRPTRSAAAAATTPPPVEEKPKRRKATPIEPAPAAAVVEPVVEPVVEQATVTVTYAAAEYITATPAQDSLTRIAELESLLALEQGANARLRAEAPTVTAGLALYIDCFPERGVVTRDLSDILAPYMRKVESEARDEKTGRPAPVPHYGLIPYNNGEKQVIGYLLAGLADITGHVTVDSRMPISGRALEVLRPLAAVVIVGRR
jgi:CRISPR/Cas system-associated exonuclease Cas4 (RecB family)